MENKSGHKMKILKTDRRGEFLSKTFNTFCESKGIQWYFTAPYTPQQNSVVKRRNRTVVDMTRSLLKSTQMPSRFWGEAVRHAVYILNRATTKALHDSTPQEAWTGRKLRLDHLRVFGCIAYMKIPAAHLKKLDDRSIPMVYLGIEAGCKAHRLFDPHQNKVHISRDVIFEESKSWMWS